MSYVLACWVKGKPFGITCADDHFELVELNQKARNKRVFSHPYRSGAQKILNWIEKNDRKLARKELSIQDEARFY